MARCPITQSVNYVKIARAARPELACMTSRAGSLTRRISLPAPQEGASREARGTSGAPRVITGAVHRRQRCTRGSDWNRGAILVPFAANKRRAAPARLSAIAGRRGPSAPARFWRRGAEN
jgi:hypothetical protein